MCDKTTLAIPDEDDLLRGVSPEQWNFPKKRPNTGALSLHEMSVDWMKFRTVDEFMDRLGRREKGHGLVKVKTGVPRSYRLTVTHDPCPEPDDPENQAHSVVDGDKQDRAKFSEKSFRITWWRFCLTRLHLSPKPLHAGRRQ